jgi:hypothetical protein
MNSNRTCCTAANAGLAKMCIAGMHTKRTVSRRALYAVYALHSLAFHVVRGLPDCALCFHTASLPTTQAVTEGEDTQDPSQSGTSKPSVDKQANSKEGNATQESEGG